jgi:uncharacterized membrane protein YagU involved in acid resistance
MIDAHPPAGRWSLSWTILVAGLVAAVTEMLVLIPVQSRLGVTPVLLFQSIDSGWQGEEAYSGGLASAAVGVGVHFGLSLAAAMVFVHASRLWPILLRRYVLAGLIYGALVYAVVTYVAIPLSAIAFEETREPDMIAMSFAVHLFLFGLPISLVNRFGASRRAF